MKRISENIIISTPKPKDVIFFQWLHQELEEAFEDNVPLTYHDFIGFESAVHKSTLFEKSMIEAFFISPENDHGYYFRESNKVDIKKIKGVGIKRFNYSKKTLRVHT